MRINIFVEFWESFSLITFQILKGYTQTPHIFTRPPNIPITPFNTKT